MMKKCFQFSIILVLMLSLFGIAFAQPAGPLSAGPGGLPPESKSVDGPPSMQAPPGTPSAPMDGPPFAMQPQEPSGDIFFSAGIVSPDGKTYYVAFDRYLLKYKLPELKLAQKVDLGIPVAPVSPSISMSSDGKWIYVIQNGMILQIEKESLSVKKTVPVNQ